MLDQSSSQRILNVPAVVWALVVVLGLIHAFLYLALTPEQRTDFFLLFAFIPARYDPSVTSDIAWPGGWAADVWTFVTYALIHANLTHLFLNAVWLLAAVWLLLFAAPVAWRLGAVRFLIFMAATAAAGAAVHLIFHFGQLLPMIGASASISGAMAAAARFAFQRGGPLAPSHNPAATGDVAAEPLLKRRRATRVLVFLLVWFGSNLLFGLWSSALPGFDEAVAWDAHVGGFLAGLLLFGIFDPVPRSKAQQGPGLQ
jgi:membrane associated rhomboid family serine protease